MISIAQYTKQLQNQNRISKLRKEKKHEEGMTK